MSIARKWTGLPIGCLLIVSGCSLLLELPPEEQSQYFDDGLGGQTERDPQGTGSHSESGGARADGSGAQPGGGGAKDKHTGGAAPDRGAAGESGSDPSGGRFGLGGELTSAGGSGNASSSGGAESSGGASGGSTAGGASGGGSSAGGASSGGTGAGASGGAPTGGSSSGGASGGSGGSGSCVTPCDCDGDGYLSDSMACGGNDCDDEDNRVHPGQTQYFAERSPNDRVGFDYDCSGTLDRDPLQGSTALSCLDLDLLACENVQGFQAPLPACGQPGSWAECKGVLLVCSASVLDTNVIARCR
jgi:hypothetical protein